MIFLVHNIMPLQYKKGHSYGALKKRSNNKKKNRNKRINIIKITKITKIEKIVMRIKFNKYYNHLFRKI